ncbi:MAG: hypothetical protein ABSG81_13735 [Acidimicrobiales bacterium]|jgi:hypothetical protein
MPWEPVTITRKDAVDVDGDQVEVVWSLSKRPSSDWAREFRDAVATRHGSSQFPGTPEPDVRLGGTIYWTVPAADLRGAVEHVKACVDGANAAERDLVARREEEIRRRVEEETAKAERLRAAQQALNALD